MKPNAVIIPSCGANLASLQFALERLGADVPLTEDPDAHPRGEPRDPARRRRRRARHGAPRSGAGSST